MKRIVQILLVGLSVTTAAQSQHGGSHKGKFETPEGSGGLFLPADVKWQPGPPALAPGAKAALLEGDPSKEGLFTMRLWFPAGYKVSPHWHSQIEHVTVISGTLHFGMGDQFDKAATSPMPAGTFGFWPPGMKHFAWTSEVTVLQLHGRGPWTITYVNASDDPRNKKQP
jgi:hypothetical protein